MCSVSNSFVCEKLSDSPAPAQASLVSHTTTRHLWHVYGDSEVEHAWKAAHKSMSCVTLCRSPTVTWGLLWSGGSPLLWSCSQRGLFFSCFCLLCFSDFCFEQHRVNALQRNKGIDLSEIFNLNIQNNVTAFNWSFYFPNIFSYIFFGKHVFLNKLFKVFHTSKILCFPISRQKLIL